MVGVSSDRRTSRELDERGVLVIEDNDGDAELVREYLPGAKVLHATTLTQAIVEVANAKPAVALVDLGLPDASGLESLARLRAAAPSLPIVVFTAHDDDELVRQALQAFAQDYVVKGAFDERLLRRCLVYAIERHAGERERERLRERMMVSERMASVGTLAAGVAHEINNPLTSVIANLELLEEELHGGELQHRPALLAMVRDARAGADRVREIIKGLRSFSRHGEERATAVDVDEVLETAIQMTRGQLRHHAKLVRDLHPVPPVSGDAGRLTQVFVNLLVNAAQAIEVGHADANTVTLRTGLRDGAVVVEVADTGRGISTDDRERIFEPFFTTKPIGEGTGLGLWICRNLVTGFGGTIEVESTVGRGTSFRVVLAPAPATASRAPKASPHSTSPPSAARRVLVIDDDPLVARSVARMLRGYDVTVASGGAEGLRVLTERTAAFDVILCDLMMPEMTGMEFFDALTPDADVRDRVVFMTGGAFTSAAREFLDRTPNRRVEKPLDGRVLRAIVEGAEG